MKLFTIMIAMMMTPALLAIAHAGPCDSDGQPALGIVEINGGHRGHWYLDDRNALGNSIWIYEETNGVYMGDPSHTIAPAHLQRGGSSPWGNPSPSYLFSYADPCVDPRPDGSDADQLRF